MLEKVEYTDEERLNVNGEIKCKKDEGAHHLYQKRQLKKEMGAGGGMQAENEQIRSVKSREKRRIRALSYNRSPAPRYQTKLLPCDCGHRN